jgi:large subunit ribosomal protein L3
MVLRDGWPFRMSGKNENTAVANRSDRSEDFDTSMSPANRSRCEVLKMTMGLVGRKCGMTRVFTDEGISIPVTVVEAQPNRITQVKTVETDGYRALQVTAGSRKPSRVSKPAAGHFAAAKVEAGDLITEFRLDASDEGDFEAGNELKVDLFEAGQKVDVIGTSIGKGFAGTVKRHNFSMQDATHGNSLSHRAPGSIGQNQTPGRVFKGKKMSGQMGNVRRTAQNLEVVRVDPERNLLLIKGAVPGHRGGKVIVRPAVKAKK